MKNSLNDQETMRQFCGTTCYYKHFLGSVYTEGVEYAASNHGVYWFIDLIVTESTAFRNESFSVWTLEKLDDTNFKITCDNGNGKILFTKELWSDFKFDYLQFYYIDKVVLLPSEY